jgi:AraC-like DNA-binding protein
MVTEDKNSMKFWIFPLGDPELYYFYMAQAENTSLYYALYIEECMEDFPCKKKEIMHLRHKCILLLDSCLVPIFCRLALKGYLIVLTEAFCEQDEIKALLRLVFFHNNPEGITDLCNITEEQEECMRLIYEEYHRMADDLQIPILRNLTVNLLMLSSSAKLTKPLKAGHLLNHALQFMELVDKYVFVEKQKSFYAKKLGITEKTLTQSLQAIYQKTFREILTYKTLIVAMEMLVFSDKNITQIAHELNYDASGFNKLFLKWKGMYPKDLRVLYRKIADYVESNY